MFDVLGIPDIAALVRPLSVSPIAFEATLWLAALSAFVVGLPATRGRLTRLEGVPAIAATVGRWVVDAP